MLKYFKYFTKANKDKKEKQKEHKDLYKHFNNEPLHFTETNIMKVNIYGPSKC
jgi:hypothetical protein